MPPGGGANEPAAWEVRIACLCLVACDMWVGVFNTSVASAQDCQWLPGTTASAWVVAGRGRLRSQVSGLAKAPAPVAL
jgi:hypothetical protein